MPRPVLVKRLNARGNDAHRPLSSAMKPPVDEHTLAQHFLRPLAFDAKWVGLGHPRRPGDY
jgi:hypothetical protein